MAFPCSRFGVRPELYLVRRNARRGPNVLEGCAHVHDAFSLKAFFAVLTIQTRLLFREQPVIGCVAFRGIDPLLRPAQQGRVVRASQQRVLEVAGGDAPTRKHALVHRARVDVVVDRAGLGGAPFVVHSGQPQKSAQRLASPARKRLAIPEISRHAGLHCSRRRRMNGASARLTRLLRENLLPFWESRAVDAAHGGYLLGHDARGRYRRGADKFLVTQARTLWFFSRLLRSAYGTAAHRAAADHGLAFLRDRLWDRDAGGFFWSVDEPGMHVKQDGKHLYGQAFALFALSEYVRNGGDRGAMQLGAELFALLESKAHDDMHGGYRQSFARDWTAATQARDYLGQPAPAKTLNTHLHLLEALLSWFVVDPEPRVRERIVELRSLLRERCAMPLGGDSSRAWGVELHHSDWSLAAADQPASYGHDVELAWLLLEADERLGETTWSSDRKS